MYVAYEVSALWERVKTRYPVLSKVSDRNSVGAEQFGSVNRPALFIYVEKEKRREKFEENWIQQQKKIFEEKIQNHFFVCADSSSSGSWSSGDSFLSVQFLCLSV